MDFFSFLRYKIIDRPDQETIKKVSKRPLKMNKYKGILVILVEHVSPEDINDPTKDFRLTHLRVSTSLVGGPTLN